LLTGAIYTGLSGLNAFSQGLQIISDNVANLNTNGFKAETVSFSDIVDSGGGNTTFTGSDANTGGQGVIVSPPLTDFSQGTLQQTGQPLDLAIQGGGFLVLQSGGQNFYARTGSFAVNQNGAIELQNAPAGASYTLAVLNTSNQAIPVNINSSRTSAPTATKTITLDQNLSSGATTATVSNVTVYDSLGTAHTWTINLTPVAASGTNAPGATSWTATVTDENGATVGSGAISFTNGVINPSASKITLNDQPSDGAAALAVTLDFSSVSSFSAGATSTIQVASVDGNAPGALSTVTVNAAGDVLLTYDNGLTKSLGAVAIANFANPQDLTVLSGDLYQNTKHTPATLVATGTSSAGSVVSGQLETSNVNLTQEFGDLILIQRGYQASSEVVSISNDMIQQLFGIRGQNG
jgi:flagellar hook protein FlgE